MSISPSIALRCRCRFHILLRYFLKEDSSATCPSFCTALVLIPVLLLVSHVYEARTTKEVTNKMGHF